MYWVAPLQQVVLGRTDATGCTGSHRCSVAQAGGQSRTMLLLRAQAGEALDMQACTLLMPVDGTVRTLK